MILLILKMTFLIVCWVMGWKIITAEGMLLEKVFDWAERNVKQYPILDGLVICEWCISNLHGLLFVWPLAFGMGIIPFEWNYKYLLAYPFCVGLSSLLSGLIWNGYKTMNAAKEFYESQTFIEKDNG